MPDATRRAKRPKQELAGRSSVETYGAIGVAIITVVFKMSWWIKIGLLIFLVGMLIDLTFHSRWTAKFAPVKKRVIATLAVALTTVVAWRPIKAQYAEETAPTSVLRVEREYMGAVSSI